MRNGNVGQIYDAVVEKYGFYPTYEEWKLINVLS